MISNRSWAFCLLALLGALSVSPRQGHAQPRLAVRTLSIAEGLSQSTGQVLLQDGRGIIWIGTQNGLNRYDGDEITIYRADPTNPDALPGTSIIDLIEDPDGGIWIATELNGLSRFDKRTRSFRTYRHDPDDPQSLSANELSAVEVDANGVLWIGTSGEGLNRLDRETGTFTRIMASPDTPGSLPSDWVIDVKALSDGHLLVATDGGGLSRFHPESGRFDTLWPTPSDSAWIPVVIEMSLDASGGVWAATPQGLVHLDPAGETTERIDGLDHKMVFSVHTARDGLVWAGTADGGLFVVAGNEAIRVDETLGLGDDTVFSLLEDHSGLIWAGTESAGVKLLTPIEDRFEALGSDMEERDTWSILARRNGEIWVGTSAGGIDVLGPDGRLARTYRSPDVDELPEGAIPWGMVIAMEEDSLGGIWIGMDGEGAARWDPETDQFQWFEPDAVPGFSTVAVTDFLEDEAGTMWLATPGWGLLRYDPAGNAFEDILLDPDSTDFVNAITSIAPAEDGWWLATQGGLARFDPASGRTEIFRPERDREGALHTDLVAQAIVTDDGHVWAATQTGLSRGRIGADGEPVFERLSRSSGLPDDAIYAVLPDREGTVWMSTNRGLAALDPETGDVRVFGVTDGLPGFEYNTGAFDIGPDSTLYFGGIEGVTRVLASRSSFREYRAPVVITSVRVFDDELATDLPDAASFSLPHDQNYLTFSFASADYLKPESNRFAYRMTPGDSDWIQSGSRRYQSYNNLVPGTYTFSVRGTNSDGTWNPEPASVTIEIRPPFWGRAWFRFLALTLILGGVFWGFRTWHRRGLRERDLRILIQRRINDRLEAERVHLARELHDGPIQQLQLSGFQLKTLGDQVGDDSEALQGVRTAVGDAMGELRSICGELRPPALVHFGLSSAIRSHAEQQLQTYDDLDLNLQLPNEETMLAPRLRLGLFRMYQEAMSNVIRHARPCSVAIHLEISDAETTLSVSDTGPGFDVPADWSVLASERHYGLLGASERAAAIGGSMTVTSKPGQGTTVSFRVPTQFEEPPSP